MAPRRPRPSDGEPVRDALRRSWAVLGDVEQETALTGALTAALVPPRLGAELEHRFAQGLRPHVRVQASPALAAVPWEALRIDDSERLVHRCDVSVLLPASIRRSPARVPSPVRPGGPVVATVDPVVPGGVAGLEPVLRRAEPLVEAVLARHGDRLRAHRPRHPSAPARAARSFASTSPTPPATCTSGT
ncbi:hypothetical protein ACFQBY_00635 [Promicromonospora citrea]|uniref:hypothetical protein n=1 Tax=Promicromonospora citrea TaxID=43677 RepID=UPI00361812ED